MLTNTQNTQPPPLASNISLRLQDLISHWGGAQRGQSISALHSECVDAVGRGVKFQSQLLPAHLLLVENLDATTLQTALRRFNGIGRHATLKFRVTPSGRFDAALIPVGRIGEPPDRFLLALEKGLTTQDQVALYGHAVGHLLLNDQEAQMGKRVQFDPRNGLAHADTLAELRLLEMVKQHIDRRVLETYSKLTELLVPPEESVATFDAATTDLRQQLVKAGWRGQFLQMPYHFTDGRVFPSSLRRGARLFVDALLRAAPSLPIAIVHTLRSGTARDDAIRRLQSYARRLALPFAYLLEEHDIIHEFDWSNSQESVHTLLSTFPTYDILWKRWTTALQLTTPLHWDVLRYPYDLSGGKKPRYYQEAAINSTVIAVLQALRGQRSPRILLTLATGTGKTQVAFQLLWKLKRRKAIRNVLFLTDRDFLLSQAMDNEFASFGDARFRIQGRASTAYDMNFATYQGITSLDENNRMLYLSYPHNFFDVVVIDECHRGSAKEASQWRNVLKYFSSAVQIGLTATPLSNETIQTDEYFGAPLYTYSLRMGINDGFLAPYRVRRVMIGQATEDEQPTLPVEQGVSDELHTLSVALDEDELSLVDIPASMELPGTMIRYTEAIAQHLAAFLQRTDPFAKTIVFCVDQAHAEQMRRALEATCAPWAPRNAAYITRIVSDEGTEGKHALGNFTTTDEKFPVIVTTSKLLSTGVDVPTCKNIVLARPIGSMVEFKQIIGRGTRLFEPQKRWFTILDYAGTIKHFFDPDFDGDPELVETEELVPVSAQAEDARSSDEVAPSLETNTVSTPQQNESISVDIADSETEHACPSLISDPSQDQQYAASPEVHEEQADYQHVDVCSGAQAFTSDIPPSLSSSSEATSQEVEQESQAIEGIGDTSHSTESDVHSEDEKVGTNPLPETRVVTKQMRDGRVLRVIGEVIYELGPDGSSLRRGTYRECTVSTINNLVGSSANLHARWLKDEQRKEILTRLEDEGVDLKELAYQQKLTELDPLDLLLSVVFQEPVVTRTQRVERLRRLHATFFKRYEHNLIARGVLDIILEKYVKGEAPDVSDMDLLHVIALKDRHTLLELSQPFADKATNTNIRTVLKELQTLLYSV